MSLNPVRCERGRAREREREIEREGERELVSDHREIRGHVFVPESEGADDRQVGYLINDLIFFSSTFLLSSLKLSDTALNISLLGTGGVPDQRPDPDGAGGPLSR